MRATVVSFGFKYGIPVDADMVVDMRFLPNPYWVPELRDHTGLDADVSDYVLASRAAAEFLERLEALLETVDAGSSASASSTSTSRSAAPAASTAASRWPRSWASG